MNASHLVSVETIKSILSGNGVTMAAMEYKSTVPVAARFKTTVHVEKRTSANVQLFQTIKDFEVYRNAVIKSANTIVENGNVTDFEVSENWFEHADANCFSVISHRKTGEQYLYFVANNAKSQYFVNGVAVAKDEIAQYLTPSEYKKVFENDGVVYNKKNDVLHTMQPRTLKIANIITLKANKQKAVA